MNFKYIIPNNKNVKFADKFSMTIVETILMGAVVLLIVFSINNDQKRIREIEFLKEENQKTLDKITNAIEQLHKAERLYNLDGQKYFLSIQEENEKQHKKLKELIAKIQNYEHEFNSICLEIYLRTFDKNLDNQEAINTQNIIYNDAIEFLKRIFNELKETYLKY